MKIVTVVVNNPDFIEIQYHTLKKFFIRPYEFIVFNDAKDFPDFTNFEDTTIKNKIREVCKKLNITCIDIPNEHHKYQDSASIRCADSMNYILNYQKQNPDKYLFLDSDMFLVDYFDIDKYSKYDCAIVLQSRNENSIRYIWSGLYYIDFTKIKNDDLLNWNVCNYCDVGGMTKEWFSNQSKGQFVPKTEDIRWTNNVYHTDNIYYIKHLYSCTWNETEIPQNIANNNELIHFLQNDVRNVNSKFFCEIYDNVFLHYRAGCNWLRQSVELHKKLTNELKKILL